MSEDAFATVEAFYLNATASGVMLSPADTHELRVWLEAGIPAELVMRVIAQELRGLQRGGARRASIPSLARLAPAVARAVRRARFAAVGRAPDDGRKPCGAATGDGEIHVSRPDSGRGLDSEP